MARGAVFDVNRLAQVSVFELLYTLLNIIEYLKQTVREKGKDTSNTIYAFCRNSELIANLFNYCTQLNLLRIVCIGRLPICSQNTTKMLTVSYLIDEDR